ncbi:MAG: tetratricopeptide repeat protein [Chloroflexota bacterium]|nr:tetratricopeptide repeat protein [Chloroflexota bacterium]
MINVSPHPTPAGLSWCDELSPPVRDLLKKALDSGSKGEWARAESCALDARDASEKSGDQVGYAAALLHLADVYREGDRPGPAQTYYEEAQTIFHRQPPRVQRQNEAAATYGLGLTHQALGDAIEALSCHQAALDLFEDARKHWATRNDKARVKACQQARQRIEGLITDIMEERTSRPARLPVFPIWRLDGAGAPFVESANLQGYFTVDRVLINGAAYRLHLLPGRSADLPAVGAGKVNHFALPVPEDGWAVPEARVGDYVLIRQQWWVDEEKAGVVWEPGSGWGAGDFKRGRDGRIRFHHRPPQVIGGAPSTPGDLTGKPKGYIIALLKPEG